VEYGGVVDEATIVFLERIGAQVSPTWTGHVPFDLDLFPQDTWRSNPIASVPPAVIQSLSGWPPGSWKPWA
jgi:hypothetical protein